MNDNQNTKIAPLMQKVNKAVMHERIRQNQKWGLQRHNMGKWLAILAEEFGEVAQAMQGPLGLTSMKDTDADDLYTELIQVAAVACAIAEQVKEEQGNKYEPIL
ncbi:MazG-like family protein [Priestia megaterium]|uniref:MazG-like family protein n=1 Tax=Priestia megaterium TaxID=1404 RepID=UPI002E1FA9A6|nr:MazG-like family protein [Priestia megaterium]